MPALLRSVSEEEVGKGLRNLHMDMASREEEEVGVSRRCVGISMNIASRNEGKVGRGLLMGVNDDMLVEGFGGWFFGFLDLWVWGY